MSTSTIVLLCFAWYLIGAIGSGFIAYKMYKEIKVSDLFAMFTFLGAGGLISVLFGLIAWLGTLNTKNSFWNKRVF